MKNATIIAMTFATLLTTGMMSANAEAATCKSFAVQASGSSAGAVAKFGVWQRFVRKWAISHSGRQFQLIT